MTIRINQYLNDYSVEVPPHYALTFHHQQGDPMLNPITAQWLGRQDYPQQWQALQHHAKQLANQQSHEIIYGCEHNPIYTTGKRGIDNRYTKTLPAPWIKTDRGGETTYHGTGQVMLYPIIHLRQRGVNIRQYIEILEVSTIKLLKIYNIYATRRCGKPGIWTNQGKIAAIGIRISRGVAYHGMALNVDVDMRYFDAINPCGLGLKAVNIYDIQPQYPTLEYIFQAWAETFNKELI